MSRSDRDPPRVSAVFGQQVLPIAATVGKTKQDVMREAKLSLSTMDRLLRGDGSAISALKVKAVLKSWGADVSRLPPIDADQEQEPQLEAWEREWLDIGRRLKRLASPQRFQIVIDDLEDLIRSHVRVAEGTGDNPRRDRG
jgi:hypothetical protein